MASSTSMGSLMHIDLGHNALLASSAFRPLDGTGSNWNEDVVARKLLLRRFKTVTTVCIVQGILIAVLFVALIIPQEAENILNLPSSQLLYCKLVGIYSTI